MQSLAQRCHIIDTTIEPLICDFDEKNVTF
jgi:hypothetical protein